ncbi:hypothetical protein PCE1_003515 [Barthelona sp. PCE]
MDTHTTTMSIQEAIENLLSMFPNVELFIVESVLATTHGNMNLAVAKLLEISDPEFSRHENPTRQVTEEEEEQIKHDEQLARMLQEQWFREEVSNHPALSGLNTTERELLRRGPSESSGRPRSNSDEGVWSKLSTGTKNILRRIGNAFSGNENTYREEEGSRLIVTRSDDEIDLSDNELELVGHEQLQHDPDLMMNSDILVAETRKLH